MRNPVLEVEPTDQRGRVAVWPKKLTVVNISKTKPDVLRSIELVNW